jgi:hypothetical protein
VPYCGWNALDCWVFFFFLGERSYSKRQQWSCWQTELGQWSPLRNRRRWISPTSSLVSGLSHMASGSSKSRWQTEQLEPWEFLKSALTFRAPAKLCIISLKCQCHCHCHCHCHYHCHLRLLSSLKLHCHIRVRICHYALSWNWGQSVIFFLFTTDHQAMVVTTSMSWIGSSILGECWTLRHCWSGHKCKSSWGECRHRKVKMSSSGGSHHLKNSQLVPYINAWLMEEWVGKWQRKFGNAVHHWK